MSIKKYILQHCPEKLLSVIAMPYRFMRWRKISRLALKYLPQYQDKLSREILSDRLEYLRTHDVNIFLDRAEKTGMKFYSLPRSITDTYSGIVVLYDNKGQIFRFTQKLLSSCEWSDKFRLMTLKEFLGGAEISSSELVVLVLTLKGRRKFNNSPRSRSLHVYDDLLLAMREDLQYFDVFSPRDDEVLIDAGAYDGATAIQFLEWGRGRVKHVYSFEFDPENAAKCEEKLKPYADKVTVVSKGTWDKDEVVRVNLTGNAGSSVGRAGDTAAYLTSIDNVVKDERVTFIKMDVEGAELKSLAGARNTIIKNHPRLAICVYHKYSDIYEIPGYILSLVPEYKFYLRHYSSRDWETVLYASCE